MKIARRSLVLVLAGVLCALLLACGSPGASVGEYAPRSSEVRGMSALSLLAQPVNEFVGGDLALPPSEQDRSAAQAQTANDLSLDDVIVTQAVDNEPLILNKDTVVRAVVGSSFRNAIDAEVTVEFDGKTFTGTKPVQGQRTVIDVNVGAPETMQTQNINVRIAPARDTSEADPSNNARTVTLPVVRPNVHIEAFFLPVDWTPEQRQRYNFEAEFPKFVEENGTFLKGAYPLGKDQITLDYTLTPHMLAANEKRLANNQGDNDMISSHLLYATISLAARRLAPQATLVVGVFPPGWFARHGSPNVLGLALGDVKGTVTAQYILTDPTTSAHELAHLFWLYEDYDYAIKPPRPFTWLDRSGYFVQKQLAQEISRNKQIPTFLSAYTPDKPSWVDTRAYEYLTAKFTIQNGGEVSEPVLLAATLARQIEPDDKNYPSDYAAGYQRFEPKNTVYVSVGAADMRGGEVLEARWFQGNRQVLTSQQTLPAGSGWYAFTIRNKSGMPEGNYRVDIYLDGVLNKTSRFEVKSSQ